MEGAIACDQPEEGTLPSLWQLTLGPCHGGQGHIHEAGFAAAYGYEWFLPGENTGGRARGGVLEALGNAHLLAGTR